MNKLLIRWQNYFCLLLNEQWAWGVRQTGIYTAEPFVPEPSISDDATGKLKRYTSPGDDQIPAGGGRGTMYSEIQKLIKLIWNK
jgi:hypothetical protein